jgi:diguanylate cyclase (GGDEF)-like protein
VEGLRNSFRPAPLISEHRKLASPQPMSEPPPRRGVRGLLFVLDGPQVGSVFTLGAAAVLIGSDGCVDVRLNDDSVSGWHARLALRSDGASLEDLDSLHGTFVDGRRVEGRTRLHGGEHIRFGSTIVKFSMADGLEERALATLFALTLRDPLTRLYNRRYFDARLAAEFSFARRHGSMLALLLIDVDHFKAVNDNCGHQLGDAVLKLAAISMRRMIRPEDVLSRYGGDEFVIIARATSLMNAETLAERICRRVESVSVKLRGREVGVTVSAGVAAMGSGAQAADAESLLAAADDALRSAKVAGRNRVVARAFRDGGAAANASPRRTTKSLPV